MYKYLSFIHYSLPSTLSEHSTYEKNERETSLIGAKRSAVKTTSSKRKLYGLYNTTYSFNELCQPNEMPSKIKAKPLWILFLKK